MPIEPEPEPACGNCRFFAGPDHDIRPCDGYCRRYPRVYLPNVTRHWVYPPTRSDEWCGEYQPAKRER